MDLVETPTHLAREAISDKRARDVPNPPLRRLRLSDARRKLRPGMPALPDPHARRLDMRGWLQRL